MLYIANAFSLNMLHTDNALTIKIVPIDIATARTMILNATNYTSAIGHADLANIVSNELGIDIPMNRISVKLTPDDTLIVAQYVGPRLPEGATKLPDGAVIKYFLIKI